MAPEKADEEIASGVMMVPVVLCFPGYSSRVKLHHKCTCSENWPHSSVGRI